jgi:gluconokinase
MTRHVVVMGVTATGKSAIGAGVAAALDVPLTEGDKHHPRENVEKMSSGVPLTDEDRWPWLDILAGLLADDHRAGRSSVLACSALRRVYRDRLRGELPEDAVFFVHLVGSRELLEQRMNAREHFMPVSLLDSQLDTLEPLEPDEHGVVVDIAPPVEEVVAAAVAALPR